jgi:hypothetical protein
MNFTVGAFWRREWELQQACERIANALDSLSINGRAGCVWHLMDSSDAQDENGEFREPVYREVVKNQPSALAELVKRHVPRDEYLGCYHTFFSTLQDNGEPQCTFDVFWGRVCKHVRHSAVLSQDFPDVGSEGWPSHAEALHNAECLVDSFEPEYARAAIVSDLLRRRKLAGDATVGGITYFPWLGEAIGSSSVLRKYWHRGSRGHEFLWTGTSPRDAMGGHHDIAACEIEEEIGRIRAPDAS